MSKQIQLKTNNSRIRNIRVKVIKAPLVDNTQLRQVIFARARAIVL